MKNNNVIHSSYRQLIGEEIQKQKQTRLDLQSDGNLLVPARDAVTHVIHL